MFRLERSVEQLRYVQPHHGRRYQSEVGQSRIPPPNTRRIQVDLAEVSLARRLLQRSLGVRDRDELAARGVSFALSDLLPERFEEGKRLGCRAGLCPDKKKG